MAKPDEHLPKEVTRANLKEEATNCMGYLHHTFGGRVGMVLFAVELNGGEGSEIFYIANVNREDMISSVKEWLARVENGLTSDPPGPRARG